MNVAKLKQLVKEAYQSGRDERQAEIDMLKSELEAEKKSKPLYTKTLEQQVQALRKRLARHEKLPPNKELTKFQKDRSA